MHCSFPLSAVAFHVEPIPRRNSRPAVLLRQAWREGKRIRRKTITDLFRSRRWPSTAPAPSRKAASPSESPLKAQIHDRDNAQDLSSPQIAR